jgi:hypothetical protein
MKPALFATVLAASSCAPAQELKLEFVFELTAQVSPPEKVPTSAGERRVVPITGGTFSGPGFGGAALQGKVLPGGADFQVIHPDGFSEIEARYIIETDQGERIYVTNRGMRHARPEIMAKLNAGGAVDPKLVYFRAVPTFETNAPRLQWMTRAIFISSGERYPDGVRIRFYRVP